MRGGWPEWCDYKEAARRERSSIASAIKHSAMTSRRSSGRTPMDDRASERRDRRRCYSVTRLYDRGRIELRYNPIRPPQPRDFMHHVGSDLVEASVVLPNQRPAVNTTSTQ